ncbi:MAG TPA: deoxyribodipyrimidine photo-lyase, partial [Streptosporangiaceae bacterium]|nr:deoxyribodipyrimidine photo-lyase [Streptosporangiaceae bacterium]
METAIVVFTRDLRVHDNPALAAACDQAGRVVPLFVQDPVLIARSPNRAHFLHDCLTGLRQALRERGGNLIVRDGDPVTEIMRIAGETGAYRIFIADDVSHYAVGRHRALHRACVGQRRDLVVTPGPAVVPPGDLRPVGGDHYKVFTPYWRAWTAAAWRKVVPAPAVLRIPSALRIGRLDLHGSHPSPSLAPGGEPTARQRVKRWLTGGMPDYGDEHDNLAGDNTSRLSAYLRFGCISAPALARAAKDQPGGEEFNRQLAWRDFFYQVTAAFPDMARRDYRSRGQRWHDDHEALQAWRTGHTGVPIVDAGMRQLTAEGFMHNRARMVTASFLTRNLRIDWRHGYHHFDELLADGDVANNAGNWQWVAGTGNDTRPNRTMNPLRQSRRFDPSGDYIRRYVPELADLDSPQ